MHKDKLIPVLLPGFDRNHVTVAFFIDLFNGILSLVLLSLFQKTPLLRYRTGEGNSEKIFYKYTTLLLKTKKV